jgi:hypothetical protein
MQDIVRALASAVSILKFDHRYDQKAAIEAITQLMDDAQANPEGVIAEYAPYLRPASRLTQKPEPRAAVPLVNPLDVYERRRKELVGE